MRAPRRRRGALREIAARLALVLGALVVCLVVAEGVARWLWSHRPPAPPRALPETWRGLPEISGVIRMATPHVRGIVKGALFETNGAGFRGPDRSVEKPPGTFRILVIGDSFAMGTGVLYEDTYAARLERIAAKYPPRDHVEVLDIGLAGLNAEAILDRLVHLGLRYNPDLIVYGYTLNDIEGKTYRESRTALFTNPFYFNKSPLYLWRYLGPRLSSLRELLGSPRGSYRFELDDNYFHNPAAWESVTAALDRLARISRARGICVVLLVHTHPYSLGPLHPFRRHYEAVAEAARERGFYVADSFPYYRGHDATSLWVLPTDSHPNAEGHALLLETLDDTLQKLPLACWETHRPR